MVNEKETGKKSRGEKRGILGYLAGVKEEGGMADEERAGQQYTGCICSVRILCFGLLAGGYRIPCVAA